VLAIATVSVMATGTLGALTVADAGGGHSHPSDVALASRSATGPVGRSGPAGRSAVASKGSVGAASRSGSTLAVPASGVPLSAGFDPANPTGGVGTAGAGTPVQIPTPTAGNLPTVAPLRAVESPDAVVMLDSPLDATQTAALPKLKGVKAIELVDTGTVQLSGAPVVAFGVDPATFRAFTPAASAASDQLWQYLAGGALVSSYEMANDRGLKLGSESTLTPSGATPTSPPVQGWLGAFASIGLPGVDLLVANTWSGDLRLTPNSGLVVSAPGLSGTALQSELQAALPGAAVELLHADQVPQTIPGNTLDSSVRQKILSAALSRVGLPYVWGGAGPNVFDCSGLVQWSYRQAGILMPRVAAEQFLTGDHIPLSDALPGDLLFWTYDPNDPGYVDHVAIYLGNGMMVVAPHTGLNVQVVPVPTADFAGAVEVVTRSS
jgi:hypothetical protein